VVSNAQIDACRRVRRFAEALDRCLSSGDPFDAKMLIEEFRRHYNEVRPHSSLDELTPAEFKMTLATTARR